MRRPGAASSDDAESGVTGPSAWLSLAVVLAGAAACGVFLQNLHRLGPAAVLALLAILVAVFWWFLPAVPKGRDPGRAEAILGALGAFGLGVFFRVHYLKTVPIGYDGEQLNFVYFARWLIERGFPYEPYSWYAHTFYSYVIALVMTVVESPIMALRVASLIISLATLLACHFCLRSLRDARAAWIGTAMLGASYWHLWMSRNGYHQLLMPLIHFLFLFSLMRGLRTKRVLPFLLAGASVAVGLHAYWGLALLPVAWVAFFLYLLVFHRPLWREIRRGALWGSATAAALSIPLLLFYAKNLKVFEYVTSAFQPSASKSASLDAKLSRNLEYLVWTLSGHPAAAGHAWYGPVVGPVVATLALLGLASALRNFRSSPSDALLTLLLAVNVAGLAITIANHFYVSALLAPVYCLVAVGVHALFSTSPRKSAVAAAVLAVICAGLIGWESKHNYREFFGKRIFKEMAHPGDASGGFWLILDRVVAAARRGRVYIARSGNAHGFDLEVLKVGERFPEYHAIAEARSFDIASPLFPEFELRGAASVEIFLPRTDFAEVTVIPKLRRLYPRLQVEAIYPPRPYRSWKDQVAAYHLRISGEDARRYQGLRQGASAGDHDVWHGLFAAPRDGEYEFRHPDGTALLLHGERVSAGDRELGTLFEAGLHPIAVRARKAEELGQLQWRLKGQSWRSLGRYLFNAGPLGLEGFTLDIASLGERADFRYVRLAEVRVSSELRDASIDATGTLACLTPARLEFHDRDGKLQGAIPIPDGWLLANARGNLWVVKGNGEILAADLSGTQKLTQVKCFPRDAAANDREFQVVCDDGNVLAAQPEVGVPRRWTAIPPLLRPWRLAPATEGSWFLDLGAGRLRLYGKDGRLVRERNSRGLSLESDLASDPQGNVYLRLYGAAPRAYTASGKLLFDARRGTPNLFPAEDAARLARLRFSGDFAVAVDRPSRTALVYQRSPASSAPSPGSASD